MIQKKKGFLCALAAVLVLSGCGTKQSMAAVEGLEKLGNVEVISREEGSGTRGAFAELAGFGESKDEEKPDGTTDDAKIVTDAEAVIAAVHDSAPAIGYLSMGALDQLNGEKVLAVDGVDGTTAHVKDGTYSLSRPFCLAWSGKLSDLEQDFLIYVMGKGQEIVGNSYVAAGKSTTFLSGQQKGSITIHGSTSAAPLMEELAEEYMKLNSHATVEVTASDSTTGLNDAMQGKCDLAMASRNLSDYEKELLDFKIIAKDGIAVIVNELNPLSGVSREELKGLFDGSISEWGKINTERDGDKG